MHLLKPIQIALINIIIKKIILKKKIKIETLDNFSIDHWCQNVLKIDTQGFEIEVLRGGGKTLKLFDVIIIECSFANEYLNTQPPFVEVFQLLKKRNFYPIIFQDYGRSISSYAFERDVIFVKKYLLTKIFYSNYKLVN